MIIDVKNVLKQFGIDTGDIHTHGNGHINDTYRVDGMPYILQRINTEVFKNPRELMENIERVTAHLRQKIVAAGGDPETDPPI